MVAGAAFAIDAEVVRRIVRTPALTPVPRAPEILLGVTALHGEVLPVFAAAALLRRLREDQELRKRYELAKMLGIEVLADELCDLADEVPAKKQSVMKARLQIDTRKWLLMKLLPHKYGDTLALKHTGDVHVTLKQFTPKPKPEGTPGG